MRIPNYLRLTCFALAGLAPGLLPAGDEPGTAGGWVKYEKNPVLGGALGTCFDVSVLRDGGKYRM